MFSKFTTQIALRKVGLGGVKIPDPFAGSDSSTKGAQNSEEGGLSNPFANVKWGAPKAFASWTTPPATQTISQPPIAGDRAKTGVKFRFPAVDGRPCVVLFLRYCGCPCTQYLLGLLVFHQLTESSHREALPAPTIVSEPTYINTLHRCISLHTSCHQRMGKKIGWTMDA